jgi:molybdate transport system substrate-binding protein
VFVASLLALGVLAGCTPPTGGDSPGRPGTAIELRVAAAASLRTAIVALRDAYTASHPGTTITIATDSSAALRTQVEQGAPFDVFLSADVANPQALADEHLAAGDPIPFASNSVALVVPADNPAAIATPADLARPGIRLVAAGARVPITTYADQVIANLGLVAGYPPGYVAALDANTVSREDNVAAVLAKIELGEGDAGFVYATDAAGSTTVLTIELPAGADVLARYAGVVIANGRVDAAADFLGWVAGSAGQAILRPLGFLAP